MVHSGPFNGLCEIESSRGSPGISNIFLPMLQLLHTTPRRAPPLPFPFPLAPGSADSCVSSLSLLPIYLLALPSDEGGDDGTLAASRRISRLPAEDASGEPERISEFPRCAPEMSAEFFRLRSRWHSQEIWDVNYTLWDRKFDIICYTRVFASQSRKVLASRFSTFFLKKKQLNTNRCVKAGHVYESNLFSPLTCDSRSGNYSAKKYTQRTLLTVVAALCL